MTIIPTADVAVVGAGPAGLLAAAAAAQAGARTVLLEALPRCGAKLLATGGGRCNLTHDLPASEFAGRYGSSGRFAGPALRALGPDALRRFFSGLGVPTRCADGKHVFPVSESARDVRDALEAHARRSGVALRPGTRASALLLEGGTVAGLETPSGRIEASGVVVATGGRSYPGLGATGDGYALAEQAGHRIVQPKPALVPLIVRERWVGGCAGVVLPEAEVRLDARGPSGKPRTGPVLFTHRGLSGPAVLDLSGDVSDLLASSPEAVVLLSVAAGVSASEWETRMREWQERRGRALLRTLLDECLPSGLASALVRLHAPEDVRASQVTREARKALAVALTACPLTVTGTEGFEKAMVTRGGVRLDEVDPRTLQSRLLPGLFFAGEVLDLDGPCGGFNLQWAFSSGFLAGSSAARARGGEGEKLGIKNRE